MARTPTKPDVSKGGTRERPPEDSKGNDDIPFGETKLPSLGSASSAASDEEDTATVDNGQAAVVPDDTTDTDADISNGDQSVATGDGEAATNGVDESQDAILPDDADNPAIGSKPDIDDGNSTGGAPSPFTNTNSFRLANQLDADVEYSGAGLAPEPEIPTIDDQPAGFPDPTDPIG